MVDYRLPNLSLKLNRKETDLGKFAKAKLEYLKSKQSSLYFVLLLKSELNTYLERFELKAKSRVEELICKKKLVKDIAENAVINEILKGKIGEIYGNE